MVDFRRWLPWLNLLAVFLGTILFFNLYNRFILDKNLKNLKTSLSVLEKASGVGQAEAALLLVDQTLVAEMAREETDPKTIATLQYAQGTLSADHPQRPVEDARTIVATSTEAKVAARPGFLATMDGVVMNLQTALGRVTLLPRQLGKRFLSKEMNGEQLAQAIRQERGGQFPEAAQIYEELLRTHPSYVGLWGLKLRLGHLYQKMERFDQAQRLYQDVELGSSDPTEIKTAQALLVKLLEAAQKIEHTKEIERRLAVAPPGPERQRMSFELGTVLVASLRIRRASEAFHAAAEAHPDGNLTMACLFKEGWCLKYLGQFEDAMDRFWKITRKAPKSNWAGLAYQQMAEIYKASGDYVSCVESYEQGIEETSDLALAAIFHAEAGAVSLIDLHDPKRSQTHFQALTERFPASPVGNVASVLSRLPTAQSFPRPEKTAVQESIPSEPKTPAVLSSSLLMEGTPLTSWLENFLPLFVDISSERLTRYMQTVGETQLTRKFTDLEFREQVLRRIQERFPGQVKNVITKIQPEGFFGSGTIQLGLLAFPVEARIGIVVVEEKPHAVIREVKVGSFSAPEALCKFLEKRVNQTIEKKQYPLKVKKYELGDGWALISVELEK